MFGKYDSILSVKRTRPRKSMLSTRELRMRNERVFFMNENASCSVALSVARWVVNVRQIWCTLTALPHSTVEKEDIGDFDKLNSIRELRTSHGFSVKFVLGWRTLHYDYDGLDLLNR